jgi:hypothetical protein
VEEALGARDIRQLGAGRGISPFVRTGHSRSDRGREDVGARTRSDRPIHDALVAGGRLRLHGGRQLPAVRARRLYGTPEGYLAAYRKGVADPVAERWILEADGDRMLSQAATVTL